MKNVLIVDDDLGFVCWLTSVLVRGEYQPWPSCSVSDAITLMGEKPNALDLVIVNPSLRGASFLISRYRQRQTNLKVLALGSRGRTMFPGATSWRQKPTAGDVETRQKWLRAVDRLTGRRKAA